MALLVRARDLDHAADYLIRCQHDRALPDGSKLWAQLQQTPELGADPVQPARRSGQEGTHGQWFGGCSAIVRSRAWTMRLS